MKQIIFATGNQTKSKRFSKGLLEKGIEVLSLKDLKIDLNIQENGKNVIENALIKVRTCYEKIHMPTIGTDDSLYLENVPEEKQPGLYVRRINQKVLNDEEMLEYYINLVKQYGINGKINCEWRYGLAIINEKGEESTYTWSKGNFYMVDRLSDNINPGYPLNSISKYNLIDKYFTDLTEEDKQKIKVSEDHVIEFIANHI